MLCTECIGLYIFQIIDVQVLAVDSGFDIVVDN